MNRTVAAVAASMLLTSAPAHAEYVGEFGGWDVVSGDDYCGMMSEFEGPGETSLMFTLYVDGSNMLIVSNGNWTAEEGKTYPLDFYLNGTAYGGGASVGMKTDYGIKKGFATKFSKGFEDDLAKGTSLKIYMGDALVDSLDLDGSGAAISRMRTCLAKVRQTRAAEEREKARLAHIPVDPFSNPAAKSAAEAASRITAPDWARVPSPEDIARYYPDRAQRMSVEGRVKMNCSVTAKGTLESCSVVSETPGDQDFGQSAIRLSRLYRMRPKTLDGSALMGGTVEVFIDFKLPK